MIELIRSRGYQLISNDKWKTFQRIVGFPKGVFTEVKDIDLIYRIKLIDILGCKKGKIIINELEKVRKLYKKIEKKQIINDGYGHAFEIFAIATIFNLEYKDVIRNYSIKGNNDGKIDAIYWDKDKAYVYQVKLNNYEASDYKEMQKNYREYMKKQDISATNSKDLKIFLNQNYERLKQLKPNFLSVSKGKTNNHNININDIYENFFKLKLFPSTQNQLILEIEIEERINDDGNVFPNYASIGEEQYFLYVNANKLVLGLKEMFGPFSLENKQKLFYENVRGVLSKNINMSETIENEAKNFSKYNNGISITGSVTNTDSTFIINNPVVVNGQQTVYTLLEFKNESNLLKKVNVPVFIKNVSDPVEKGKIAHYNNSQRAIKAIDLLSINKNIRELQKTIYDLTKGNCYLNIYSSGRVEYHEFSKKIIENNNIIPLSDFIKLYYTILEPKNIGDWKNRISFSIENHMLSIKDEYKFDANIILEVIDVLDLYRNIFEDNKDKISDLKVADLAIQYMLHYYKHDKDAVLKTMEIINEDNFNGLTPENRKYSSIAAIYKNKHTYTHIEDAIKKYELILNNQNKNNSKD